MLNLNGVDDRKLASYALGEFEALSDKRALVETVDCVFTCVGD